MRIARRIALFSILGVLAIAGAGLALLWIESAAKPDTSGEYVGLGSSFAAGPKLSALAPGSPHACWRTAENYAHLLARATSLRLVDVSCGGATTSNLLTGGPFFQPPQVDAVGPSARLVTITIGGNDVAYIGDLGLMVYRSRGGMLGALVGAAWHGPKAATARPFDGLTARLVAIVNTVHQRAPRATVVLVTYPRVLPSSGTCAGIEVSEQEASLMRGVAAKLAAATKNAAAKSGALFVDMNDESAGHDACSDEPWVYGSAPPNGAMFHPTPAGARATASALERVVRELQSQGRL